VTDEVQDWLNYSLQAGRLGEKKLKNIAELFKADTEAEVHTDTH